MTVTCPSCGTNVKETDRFCSECGCNLQSALSREQSVIREHEAPAPSKRSPHPPPGKLRSRKATVIGLSSVLADLNEGESHASPSASAPPTSDRPPSSSRVRTPNPPAARRGLQKTIMGIPFNESASSDKSFLPDAATVGAEATPAALPEPSQPSDPAYTSVPEEEHFEPLPTIKRRKRFFRVWGVLILASVMWLLYRYLETQGGRGH